MIRKSILMSALTRNYTSCVMCRKMMPADRQGICITCSRQCSRQYIGVRRVHGKKEVNNDFTN